MIDIYTYLPEIEYNVNRCKSIAKCKVIAWNTDKRRIYLTLQCYGRTKVVKIPCSVLTGNLDVDLNTINGLARRELR